MSNYMHMVCFGHPEQDDYSCQRACWVRRECYDYTFVIPSVTLSDLPLYLVSWHPEVRARAARRIRELTRETACD